MKNLTKHIKPAGILLFFWLFSLNTMSQEQISFLDSLVFKLQKFCTEYPREEIFIHTDRKEYIAGESIWFKIYLVDRQSNKLSVESRLAYFEILNERKIPVIQKRIKIDNGNGPGQIVLPDTLSSGIYTIRSYTNWMKNFLPSNFFLQKIIVYNALNAQRINITSGSKEEINDFYSDSGLKAGKAGFELEVNNQPPDTLDLNIDDKTVNTSSRDSYCYLFIQTRGNVNYKKMVTLENSHAGLKIPKRVLTSGINQITVFSSSGKPVAERYIYTPSVNHPLITVSATDIVSPREKVSFEVAFRNISSSPRDTSCISISVATASDSISTDLTDYMILGSEFGTVPDEVGNSNPDKLPAGILEKYLSVLQSNWINWDSVLSGHSPVIKYGREKENHFLYGKLIDRRSQKPLADEYLLLSTPGKSAIFQYARTDNNGDFSFSLPINEKMNDIIIQPDKPATNKSIRLKSSFTELKAEAGLKNIQSSGELKPYLSEMTVNYQVRKIYGISDSKRQPAGEEVPVQAKRFYGKPDIELFMDDYIKLPVMQEVFFELVPGVAIRKKKSDWEIKLLDQDYNTVQEGPPVIMVDGVIIEDPSIIAELDPDIVERIDVIKEMYYVGDYMFFGIVNVVTRAGDFSNFSLPDYAIRLSYKVADKVNDFCTPEYSTAEMRESRVPDFRNTLYWNPSVKYDNDKSMKVEFWSGDLKSDYEINIQGITSGGYPVSFKRTIRVVSYH